MWKYVHYLKRAVWVLNNLEQVCKEMLWTTKMTVITKKNQFLKSSYNLVEKKEALLN